MTTINGFIDIEGEIAQKRFEYSSNCINSFLSLGYQMVEFPMLEPYPSSIQILDDVFITTDKANGQLLILTPDITSQVIRYAKSKNLNNQIQICYTGKVARAKTTDEIGNRSILTAGIEKINIKEEMWQVHSNQILSDILTTVLKYYTKNELLIETNLEQSQTQISDITFLKSEVTQNNLISYKHFVFSIFVKSKKVLLSRGGFYCNESINFCGATIYIDKLL